MKLIYSLQDNKSNNQKLNGTIIFVINKYGNNLITFSY